MLCLHLMESYCATWAVGLLLLVTANKTCWWIERRCHKEPNSSQKVEGSSPGCQIIFFLLKLKKGSILKTMSCAKNCSDGLDTKPWNCCRDLQEKLESFLIIQLKLSDFFSGRTEMPSSGSGRTSRSIERTTTTSKDSFPRNQSPIKSFGAKSTGPWLLVPPITCL